MTGWSSPQSDNRFLSLLLLLVFLFLDRSRMGASFAPTAANSVAFAHQNRIRMLFYPSKKPSTTAASSSGSCLFLTPNQPTADGSCEHVSGSTASSVFTDRLSSKSGLPVCRYALGGAARSTQPASLVRDYCDGVIGYFGGEATAKVATATATTKMAPFLFYYNPHRYPDFMKGVRDAAAIDNNTEWKREDLFLASGGSDRSEVGMEQRLSDALEYSGGDYLDMFVLEYVCPDEVDAKDEVPELLSALAQARSWVRDGRVRYVAASTHSHEVGAWLGSLRSESLAPRSEGSGSGEEALPLLDAMMLRYNMGHKSAAEQISFPVCSEARIPVLAFTTTRWNKLQTGHPDWPSNEGDSDSDSDSKTTVYRTPTTAECLSFALSPSRKLHNSEYWPVEIVLHSARTNDEWKEAMDCLSPSSSMTATDAAAWRDYGNLEWNDLDGFDEYPEEQESNNSNNNKNNTNE